MGLQRLLHPPWALESETATSSMGSGVGVSHGRRGIKFRLCHSGVVVSCSAQLQDASIFFFVCLCLCHSGVVIRWRRAATLLHPRVCLSSSLYVSIFIYLHLHPPTLLFIHLCFWLHISPSFSIFVHLCGSAMVVYVHQQCVRNFTRYE